MNEGGDPMHSSHISESAGEEIRSTRRARNLTQDELAELAHVSTRTIRNIEAGKETQPGTMRAVYKALGMRGPVDLPDDDAWVAQLVAHRLSKLSGEAKQEFIDAVIALCVPR